MQVNIIQNLFLDYIYYKLYDRHPLFTKGDRLNKGSASHLTLKRHHLVYKFWIVTFKRSLNYEYYISPTFHGSEDPNTQETFTMKVIITNKNILYQVCQHSTNNVFYPLFFEIIKSHN